MVRDLKPSKLRPTLHAIQTPIQKKPHALTFEKWMKSFESKSLQWLHDQLRTCSYNGPSFKRALEESIHLRTLRGETIELRPKPSCILLEEPAEVGGQVVPPGYKVEITFEKYGGKGGKIRTERIVRIDD